MEYKIGDKVIFINNLHLIAPMYYPPLNTVGTIVGFSQFNSDIQIQWPKGSTSKDDRWFCVPSDIKPFNSTKRIVDIQPYLDKLVSNMKLMNKLGFHDSTTILFSIMRDLQELPILAQGD